MRLTKLKVSTTQTDSGFLITILPGELRFVSKVGEVVLAELLTIEVDGKGQFTNFLRNVAFDVNGRIMQWSVFSIVTHEDFEPMLYMDENALYGAEYERLYG